MRMGEGKLQVPLTLNNSPRYAVDEQAMHNSHSSLEKETGFHNQTRLY